MITRSIAGDEFEARVAEALRWAAEGPVFITEHGEPMHVLLSIEEYTRIANGDAQVGAGGSSSAQTP